MPRTPRLSIAEKARIHRQRRREAGIEEVLFQLPGYAVEVLDALKERQGLRNRSQVLLQLIEEKGATAQHMT
jgi:hypothetical protein